MEREVYASRREDVSFDNILAYASQRLIFDVACFVVRWDS